MFDTSRRFEAYATVEAGLYMLKNLMQHLRHTDNMSESEYKGCLEKTITVMEDIISAKKYLRADSTRDENFLKDMLLLLVTHKEGKTHK